MQTGIPQHNPSSSRPTRPTGEAERGRPGKVLDAQTASIARAFEQLRQERETFNQAKDLEGRWFFLRLIMGYSAVALLAAIMIVASYVLFNASDFPGSVLTAAGGALFVDALGLVIAVWKIALNPTFYARLAPVTRVKFQEPEHRVAVPTQTTDEEREKRSA